MVDNKEAVAGVLRCVLLNELQDSSASSSDSDEDAGERQPPRDLPKSREYFSLIKRMDESEFRSHFRLGYEAFNKVTDVVEANRITPHTHGLSSRQKSLVSLWYLASDSSFRTISQQFGIAMSTAHAALKDFVGALLREMSSIVTMPNTDEEFHTLADNFYLYKYPNVVGAIDGTLIQISPPEEHRLDYFTRKYVTAVNLTVVCDANKRILYGNVGQSGRCHDSHIFTCSSLGMMINDGKIPDQYHIIGDAAYGLSKNVIVPYPGDNLPMEKDIHNKAHSSTRMVVERCFGDLKGRWLRLNCLRSEIPFANKIIAACCCLHNISIDYEDILPTERQPVVAGAGNHDLQFANAKTKRDAIAGHIAHRAYA